MNAFAYLVRRETWEHKAIYRAPLITAAVVIVVTLLALFKASAQGFFTSEHIAIGLSANVFTPENIQVGSAIMFGVLYGLIFMVGAFVAVFYLLDCLYAERKNRSILFWKSLPISDTETVLAKLVTAGVLMPVFVLISGVACWLIMQVIAAVTFGLLGGSGWLVLWQPEVLFIGIGIALKSSTALLLWYLPFAGWFLLVSVWARRSVFLWAAAPPAIILFVENWFGTHYFANLLGDRLVGFKMQIRDSELVRIFGSGADDAGGVTLLEAMSRIGSFGRLFSEPGLYGGVLVAAAFVTGAIFLRRYRDET